ncbi:MAG: formate/nitrite transporter family protein [Mollicutes bacterium]|nr:formate/nitrite transporter family protein [Mollicutes bacterium]
MRYLKVLLLGFMAGIMIAFGGLTNVTLISRNLALAGNLLFVLGLLGICFFSFNLYTGKVGYVFNNKPSFLLDLLLMYIGNFIGAITIGYLIRVTSLYSSLDETIMTIVINKTNINQSNLLSLFILSLLCGILVFLSVELYKREIHPLFKVVGIFLFISCFVICGFEHCIANMFYFALSNSYFVYPLGSFLNLLIVTIGNSIGAIVIYFIFYFIDYKKKL